MAKADKLLRKWRQSLPKDARAAEVFLLLESYDFLRIDESGGSHFQFYHKALESRPDLYPFASITIPLVSGRAVKPPYIKKLLAAIDVVETWIAEQDKPDE